MKNVRVSILYEICLHIETVYLTEKCATLHSLFIKHTMMINLSRETTETTIYVCKNPSTVFFLIIGNQRVSFGNKTIRSEEESFPWETGRGFFFLTYIRNNFLLRERALSREKISCDIYMSWGENDATRLYVKSQVPSRIRRSYHEVRARGLRPV